MSRGRIIWAKAWTPECHHQPLHAQNAGQDPSSPQGQPPAPHDSRVGGTCLGNPPCVLCSPSCGVQARASSSFKEGRSRGRGSGSATLSCPCSVLPALSRVRTQTGQASQSAAAPGEPHPAPALASRQAETTLGRGEVRVSEAHLGSGRITAGELP